MKQEWMNRPVSSMHLEQYALGELPEAETRSLEERLASDPALRRRLEAIEAHTLVFEDACPAGEMLPRIEAALRASRREGLPGGSRQETDQLPGDASRPRASRARSAAPARRNPRPLRLPSVRIGLRARPRAAGMALMTMALVAALAAVTFHANTGSGQSAEQDGVRLKGQEPELRLYRSTPGGPERVLPGAPAAAGDIYQAEFHPGDFAYGAIASVDGNGSVTLHWPPRADAGTDWSALPGHRLPKAFQLDAAPGFERFHLLLSREPLALEALLPLVAASSRHEGAWLAGALPQSVHVVTFSLRKEP